MNDPWRLIVLCTTVFRPGGALFCLAGTICLLIESDYVKYARSIKRGQGGYAWGDVGWMLFESGAYFISFDGLVSLFYSTMTRKGLKEAWPFYPSQVHTLRNSIRDGALGFGFLFIGIGAGSTTFAYPNNSPFDYMSTWVAFYETRHTDRHLRNGAYLLLIGSTLLVISVVSIAIYCERLDVFYILPCSRCKHERRPTHETMTTNCCLNLGRPQPVACVIQTGCTAIYQNNLFGAFFNHVYPAYLLYFIGSLVWLASLNVSIYSPACIIPLHNMYDHGLVHTCNHQEEDVGFYMIVSNLLFVAAATLFTIHALVYYLSIILNRPLIVNNFEHTQSHIHTSDTANGGKRWSKPGLLGLDLD